MILIKKKEEVYRISKEILGGKYNFLGEHGGYLVYQPLDHIASMDLGINTGWCTTGRYGHHGHPEYTPSEADAKQHFNDYTSKGVKFYYFLNPDTFYGEYAIALYPEIIVPDEDDEYIFDTSSKSVIKINGTNFELFNAEDTNIGLDDKIKKIANNIGLNLRCDIEQCPDIIVDENGIEIKDKAIVYCWNKNIKTYVVPNNIISIKRCAFISCSSLISITIPNSVTSIEQDAFWGCISLRTIYYSGKNPEIIKKLAEYADVVDPETGEVIKTK